MNMYNMQVITAKINLAAITVLNIAIKATIGDIFDMKMSLRQTGGACFRVDFLGY